jgi:archaetidylinositol phosphate synthase
MPADSHGDPRRTDVRDGPGEPGPSSREPTGAFAGATKANPSWLGPIERRFAPWVLPMLPRWLETYHLTALTLLWSAGVIGCSLAARGDRRWLWGASAMVVLQWVTDHLDGKLGKYRGTGLERWGFYVDHVFDAFFISAIFIGYAWLLPDRALRDLIWLFAGGSGLVVHTVLRFATTSVFRISYLRVGPTELRLGVVLLNVVLVQQGFEGMANHLRPAAAIVSAVLALRVYVTQRDLWRLERRAPRSAA